MRVRLSLQPWLAVTACMSLLGMPAKGNDWPMFGGAPQRNMVNSAEKDVPAGWSIQEGQRKNIKWVAELGTVAYGGPVVAGGKVFVGTNNERPRDPKIRGDRGVVMCFRESDGKFLWQKVHDKLPSGQENDWPYMGVASCPAVEGNRLYYVSNRCEVICADTDSGADVWRYDMIKELHVFPRFLANCSPVVGGDLVFVATSNGVNQEHVVAAPEAPSLIALDKRSGKLIWKDNSPGNKIMDGQWSSPAYAEVNGKPQVIFAGGDGWLRGFEAKTGQLVWKFDCNPKKSEYSPGRGTRNYFLATPAAQDGKVYVGVGRDPDNEGPGLGRLWCLDITKTGDLSPLGDDFDPKAEVNKNSGLVWHFGGPAPKGGVRDYVFGRTLSTCAVHHGLAYVADLDGFFYCFDAQTGKKYWDEDFKTSVWGSPYWVDGKVYIGTDDGDIHVFAHGKEKKELGKIEMADPIQTTPVAANGVLYVMTKKNLYAIASK